MAGKTTNAALRKLWFQVHLWIGVALFLVLIPVSVSGSLLVWHDPLDRLMEPQRYETTGPATRPLADYAAAARTVLKPDEPVAQIRLPAHDGDPVVVSAPMSFAGQPAPKGRPPQHVVYVDPGAARVLDHGSSAEGLTRFMHVLHGSLFIPEVGRKVVGWLGWLMLVSCLTGIWIWWPRNGAVLKGFRWNRSPLFTGKLHHVVGIWVSIPLAVLSLTGAYISFPQTMRKAISPFVGAPVEAKGERGGDVRAKEGGGREGRGKKAGDRPRGGPQARPRPLANPALDPDAAVASAAALQASNGLPLAAVSWPTVKTAEWSVTWREGEQSVEAVVEDAAGARARVKPKETDPAQSTARLMRRIHDGVGLGWFWQTIIFVGGMAPLVLGITGVIMWLKLRGGRRSAEAARKAAG